MKKITYVAATVMALSSMLSLSTLDVLASGESISVSVDKPNAEVGDTVTVTVTAHSDQDIYGGSYSVYVNGVAIDSVDYDSAGLDNPKNITNSFKFVVDQEGAYTVSLQDTVDLIVMTGDAESPMSTVTVTPNSATVTATAPTTQATTAAPTQAPTEAPTQAPTQAPTEAPTQAPTQAATQAPTEPATQPSTEAPTAAPAEITGIDVTYAGGEKRAGDTVSGIELSVAAVYSDGTSQPVSGWICDQVGQPLQEGDNVFVFRYDSFSKELTITASAGENSTEESSEETSTEEGETETETEEDTSEEDTTETETTKIPYIQVVSPFGGDDLYLASDWNESAPDGFEEDSITYAGYAVKVVKSESGIVLAYMTDKEGNNGEFYIYDPDSQKFSYYTGIPVSGNTFYILSVPDDFDDTGFTKMTLSVDGKTLSAYQLSDSQAEGIVCLVYAMDIDGNKGYYRFDTGLKTFVRYYADSVKETEDESAENTSTGDGSTVSRQVYDELEKKYVNESWLKIYIIVALIVLAVILFVFVIVLAMKLRKIYNEYDFIDEDDEEEDAQEDDEASYSTDEDSEEVAYEDDDFRVDLSGMEDDDQK